MNELEIKNLQKQLDEKKYFQSQTARQDLGGRMEYCAECYFLKFDTEKKHLICNLDEHSRVVNQVCAKNYLRGKENAAKRVQSKAKGRNTRTIRQTDNGES